MKVGVHCSVRKGFIGALEEAQALGCETFQMFTQSPRGWKTREYTEEEFAAFRAARAKTKIDPVVVHSPYLPNLCTSDPELYAKSLQTLKADLIRCEKLGAKYLVIHPGAFSPNSTYQKGLEQLSHAINSVLAEVKGESMILIENVAGGGRRMGSTVQELADMLGGIKNRVRIGICFDTCHAFGAGYNLNGPMDIMKMWEEFDDKIGLNEIQMFHVNDSKGGLGSHRDLHQHLGEGFIGLEGFRTLFNHPALKDRVLILETPKDPPGSDLKNIKNLKSCLPAYAI